MNQNDAQRFTQDAFRRFWPSKLNVRLIAIALLIGTCLALASVVYANHDDYLRVYGARCPSPNADPKKCIPTEFWFVGHGWPVPYVMLSADPAISVIAETIQTASERNESYFRWKALLFDVVVFSSVAYGALLVANRFRPRSA